MQVKINGYTVEIDPEDQAKIMIRCWQTRIADSGNIYFENKPNRKTTIALHQLILPGCLSVDHKDGNTLNCRKQNLRNATVQQQMANVGKRDGLLFTSQYKGVSFYSRTKKWRARIKVNYSGITIGYYNDEIDAAKAYDKKAIQYFGEFAKLNFPGEINAQIIA